MLHLFSFFCREILFRTPWDINKWKVAFALKAGGSLCLLQQNGLKSLGGTPGDAGNVDSGGTRAGENHLSLALGPFGMASGKAHLYDIPWVRLL